MDDAGTAPAGLLRVPAPAKVSVAKAEGGGPLGAGGGAAIPLAQVEPDDGVGVAAGSVGWEPATGAEVVLDSFAVSPPLLSCLSAFEIDGDVGGCMF